jgi:hypothetical protein
MSVFNGSSNTADARGVRGGGGAATASLALDNMLRNHLRLSNPRDPKQVADGLLAYYQGLPQAEGIRQESLGLPFLQSRIAAPVTAPAAPGAADAEFQIANGDVEKALQDLASNALTNDITPEMQGWADSIRTAIAQGNAAACQGLDPTHRDRVMWVRRQLSEYARMTRMVGSFSSGMTQNFRRLAKGLDEVSAVLLVKLAESMASVGMASGYYLLSVPVQELQQRRDAVIYALRSFISGTQINTDQDQFPRALDAYRRVYDWLEQQGQGDLRSMLLENEVAATMDALITRAKGGDSPNGLRGLGVTAQIDIERFRRFAVVAMGSLAREDGLQDRNPVVESYVQALLLFSDTFRRAGGIRLLRVGRPPALLYGLYNVNQLEDDRDLIDLVMVRGMLATIFDTLFPCDGMRGMQTQVLMDMLLSELDRGLDLLYMGSAPAEAGPTEWRSTAFWAIVKVITNLLHGHYGELTDIAGANLPALPGPITNFAAANGWFRQDLQTIYSDYISATRNVPNLTRTFRRYNQINLTHVPAQLSHHGQMKSVGEELRVQMSLESRWEDLVRTVAPQAGDQESVFILLRKVIDQAMHDVNIHHLPPLALPLPQQYEQSLAIIAGKI